MLYDISFFAEFIEQDQLRTYDELFNYFNKLSPSIYNQFSIYQENHHFIPTHETKENTITILVPISFHFKLHLLRAREQIEKFDSFSSGGNYYKAYRIYKKWKHRCYFNAKEVEECNVNMNKGYQKGFTYEQKYGFLGGRIKQKKISEAMKKIDNSIIAKRNQAISEGRKKKVVDLNSLVIFSCAEDAQKYSTYSVSWIRKCCEGKTSIKLYEYK